ncbi:LysR family transcriptional regulator [Chromohalobacter canadensis]|uniref:LysR family transcriptional regulator n=1 Tax=Chromohalobacter canadensis TaxID=141389 RepID=A0ABZ0YCP4_9GAMM|nr:LysR family transcriptional regulator [Chromohalobacter canadensis]MCK0767574.1 LysR family transcriptional regulator [Chromohalobacter canadensis]WQH09825.1 LysR family transcriptional regulator [Chromohalobacter canadensis]
MFDFKEIEAFVWIVQLGSFRLAARHLHLTQPSVSDRIARLESIVGEPLLERTQRPIQPTPKGRQFHRHALRLMDARQEAMTMLELATPFQGTLRLGVVESIAHSWLPQFLAELSQRFPDMTLELEVDSSPGLAAKLHNRDVDMAFLMGPVNVQEVFNRFLCHYTMGLIASPYLGLDPANFSLHRLRDLPLITFARDSRPYRELGSLLHQQKLEHLKLHCSSSLWTIVRMTLDGLGIGAIPPRLAQEELSQGKLIELPLTLPELEFTASWPQHLDKSLAEGVTELAIEIARFDQQRHNPHA